jgi:hypothetical protein
MGKKAVKEYLILGADERDVETQRDRWLSENPGIRLIKADSVKREPPSLLTRIGGKRVPRFSILVRYEEVDVTQQDDVH